MAKGGAFRPPKPWQLTESETINSFANWKSNLSLNNEIAQFLDSEWAKKPVANRGLQAVTTGNDTKTAVQKAIVLERMLGLVAQFVLGNNKKIYLTFMNIEQIEKTLLLHCQRSEFLEVV